MDYPGFVDGSYESLSRIADGERLVNWYVEVMESPNASTESALYPTPGFEELVAAAVGPGRAHKVAAGREFAIINTTLYEVAPDGTSLTSRGTVALDANPATISYNSDAGGQLFITSGSNGYCYALDTDTLSQVAALNGIATMGGFVDGYFLALNSLTGTLYVSALYDGSSWTTGTDYAQRSIASDPWVGMCVQGRYIWLIGAQTGEIWYNSGGASFPFAPHSAGAYVPYGLLAPFSLTVGAKGAAWLSGTLTGGVKVCYAEGLKPQEISTMPIQQIFGAYDRVDDAMGDMFTDRGHNFYRLHFPAQNITWGWDAETMKWHECGTWDPETNAFKASRARWAAFTGTEQRWLDSETGAVYRMNADLGTDVDGMAIRRMRVAPCISTSGLDPVFYATLELDLEVGVGATSGQGSDPQVMLRYSNDGGKTWSREMMRSAGKRGQYNRRVRWNMLGSGRRRVFEISVTDPTPWRVLKAYVQLAQQPGGQVNRGAQRTA